MTGECCAGYVPLPESASRVDWEWTSLTNQRRKAWRLAAMALSATAALCAFTLLVQQDAAAPILATIVGKVEPKLQLAQWTPAVAAELKSSLPDEVTK